MEGRLNDVTDPDAVRETSSRIEEVWSATIERARSLPEAVVQGRVNDEWSLVETLRHLIFVTDAWVGRTILSDANPYHRLGLPPDGDVDVRPWGIDVTAKPSFGDVLECASIEWRSYAASSVN